MSFGQMLREFKRQVLSQGLLYGSEYVDNENQNISSLSVAIDPTNITKEAYSFMKEIQIIYQELYMKITLNPEKFLIPSIRESASIDSFIGGLLKIYERVSLEGCLNTLEMNIFRSDYMISEKYELPKQIEFNTISVSFIGCTKKMYDIHKYMLDYYNQPEQFKSENIPNDEPCEDISKGFAQTIRLYEEQNHAINTLVIFMVLENEQNIFDQAFVQRGLQAQTSNIVVYLNINQARDLLEVDCTTRKLYFLRNKTSVSEIPSVFHPKIKENRVEVSLVYFRSLYTSSHYDSEEVWETRYQIERSIAVKVPSILMQLAGSKIIQQKLVDKEILEMFISKEKAEKLSKSFVAIHSLDRNSKDFQKAKSLALNKFESMVLKPQREGGGNNYFGNDIPKQLLSMPESEWVQYIIMERIFSKSSLNTLLLKGNAIECQIVPEFGIIGYGIYNQETKQIEVNCFSGSLVRVKAIDSDEGGVCAGFGGLGSIHVQK